MTEDRTQTVIKGQLVLIEQALLAIASDMIGTPDRELNSVAVRRWARRIDQLGMELRELPPF